MPQVKTAERRRQIVEAAIRVIGKEGLERATTRRIAAEAGVPLGTLHNVFPDKDTLITAVYSEWIASVERYVGRLVSSGCGIDAGVRALLFGFLDYFESDMDNAAALYELILWVRRAELSKPLAVYAYEALSDAVCTAMQRAATEPLDPAAFREPSWLFINCLDGVALQYLSNGDVEAARRQLERFACFIAQEIRRP